MPPYIIAVAAFVLLSPTGPAGSVVPTHPTTWWAEQARSETFRIHAEGVEDSIRDLVARDLARAEAQIASRLGSFPDTVSVRILPDRVRFSEALRKTWAIPETACWMVGAADDHALYLLSPAAWETEACEHDPEDDVHRRNLVAHEAAHAYHGQVNPSDDIGRLEDLGWFIEGFATQVSGQVTAEHAGRALEAVEKGVAPSTLVEVWSGEYRYAVTGAMVAFIEKRWGRDVLRRLLTATSTEEALATLELGEQQFLRLWRSWVQERSAAIPTIGESDAGSGPVR